MAYRIRQVRKGLPGLVLVVQCLPDCETWKLPHGWEDDVRRQLGVAFGKHVPVVVLPPGVILDTLTLGVEADDGDDDDEDEDGVPGSGDRPGDEPESPVPAGVPGK